MATKVATLPKVKRSALPKKLGQLIDYVQVLQQERDQYKQLVTDKDAEIAAVLKHLETNFDAAEINGAQGMIGVSTRRTEILPRVVDWDTLYAHIKKTGQFDLLHKRVGSEACRARWGSGTAVPGVEQFERSWIEVKPIKGK